MKNVILNLRNQHILWTDLQRGPISYKVIVEAQDEPPNRKRSII